MPERSLRRILDELHESLENAGDIDEAGRQALRGAADEIREALDAEPAARGGEGEVNRSVSDRLSAALEQFEESHPTLTETVRRLVDQLSDMGI